MGMVDLAPPKELEKTTRVPSRGIGLIRVDVDAERDRVERLERSRRRLARPVAPVVDGFLLLEACGVEFPDEGHRADV